jgi:predicted metal-dependent HD superfamily phosphohydrolase
LGEGGPEVCADACSPASYEAEIMSLDLNRWITTCAGAGVDGDCTTTFRRLIDAYSEPHRHYHNLRHISECQREFDAVLDHAKATEPIELAIWFHDAIYDTKETDNEEKSARWAEEFLASHGAAAELVDKVSKLVLATKRHDIGLDDDAGLLIDIDLSILGQPEKRFWEYETQIRQEYSWVNHALFKQKRVQILDAFLVRERIYSTRWFYERYEQQARRNLRASIERLSV